MTLSLAYARETIPQGTYDIDHPAEDSYLQACLDVPNEAQRQALRERFKYSEVHTDPELVIEWLGTVSVQAGMYRQQFERVVVGAGGFALDAQGLKRYESLAGNPERLAEYADWFGVNAIEYFRHTANEQQWKRMDKVALELGGKLQGGDWESTRDLDNMARLLPYQIASLGGIEGLLREGSARLAPRYRFMPLWTELDQKAVKRGEARWHPFDFGLVRRRRPVLDLLVERGGVHLKIDVYKEFLGLVIMSELTEGQQTVIRKDVAENPEKNVLLTHISKAEITREREKTGKEPILPQSNTVAALVAGAASEVAIKSDPGSSRDISPASAHYVMRAVRPPEFS